MSFMLYNKKNNSNKINKPRTKLKKNKNIYESEKVDKVYMSFSLTTLLQTDDTLIVRPYCFFYFLYQSILKIHGNVWKTVEFCSCYVKTLKLLL